MIFEIKKGAEIIVTRNGEEFLYASSTNRISRKLTFYRRGELILQTTTCYLFLKKWVKINYQALSLPIQFIRQEGLKSFRLETQKWSLLIQGNVMTKPLYCLLLGEKQVGEINSARKVSFDYEYYSMEIGEINDDELSLYFLILFLSQSLPLS